MSTDNKGQRIPKGTRRDEDRHWWMDSQRDSPWSSPTQECPMTSSPDPKIPIPLPAAEDWDEWQRDSLKNLEDFVTHE